VAGRAVRALSFGGVADDYDRLRPGPPAAALDWLLPERCRRAVDLGAGTGLFTRALAGRVAEVVAVEPDERMRRVLHRRSPGAWAVGGVSEAIPVRAGWADAVCASSAWHWMDPVRAVPEIARVLRPGGRLALVWTSRDREVDWVRDLDRLRTDVASESDEQVEAQRRRHDVTLPEGSPFVDADVASFAFERVMPLDDVVAWLGTYSVVIVASEAARAAGLGRVRAALRERFGDASQITVPMRSWCWRASRRAEPTGS
jgi:SAM-dependent methyltransferase